VAIAVGSSVGGDVVGLGLSVAGAGWQEIVRSRMIKVVVISCTSRFINSPVQNKDSVSKRFSFNRIILQ
jgi:hypothetical protein